MPEVALPPELDAVLDELRALVARYRQEIGIEPADGSPYATEVDLWVGRGAGDANPAHACAVFAGVGIAAAIDHLDALQRALRAPSLVYAPMTVGRAIAELSARAGWLLEPEIPPELRARRTFTESLHSHFEAERILTRLDRDSTEAADRLKETRADAERLGFRVCNAKDPQRRAPWVEAAPRPTASELVAALLEGEPMAMSHYAYTSQFTHGMGSMLASATTVVHVGDGRSRITPTITSGTVVGLSRLSALAAARAFSREISYYGWSPDELETHATAIEGVLVQLDTAARASSLRGDVEAT